MDYSKIGEGKLLMDFSTLDKAKYLNTKYIGDIIRTFPTNYNGYIEVDLPDEIIPNGQKFVSNFLGGFLMYITAVNEPIKNVEVYTKPQYAENSNSSEQFLKGINYAHKLFDSDIALINLKLRPLFDLLTLKLFKKIIRAANNQYLSLVNKRFKFLAGQAVNSFPSTSPI